MSTPSHLDHLREAVQRERSEEALRMDRCDSFLEKVILFQSGHGPLPDELEFLLWREDLKWALAVRALKAGVTDAAQSPPGDGSPGVRARAAPGRGKGN